MSRRSASNRLIRKQLSLESLEARAVLAANALGGAINVPPPIVAPRPCDALPPAMQGMQNAAEVNARVPGHCAPSDRLVLASLTRLANEVQSVNVALGRILEKISESGEEVTDAVQAIMV